MVTTNELLTQILERLDHQQQAIGEIKQALLPDVDTLKLVVDRDKKAYSLEYQAEPEMSEFPVAKLLPC